MNTQALRLFHLSIGGLAVVYDIMHGYSCCNCFPSLIATWIHFNILVRMKSSWNWPKNTKFHLDSRNKLKKQILKYFNIVNSNVLCSWKLSLRVVFKVFSPQKYTLFSWFYTLKMAKYTFLKMYILCTYFKNMFHMTNVYSSYLLNKISFKEKIL
jgi:hypothetical protein